MTALVSGLALALDIVVTVLVLHAVLNCVLLRRPDRSAAVEERVSILIPVRNEARRITPTLTSVVAQQGLREFEVLVYDDGSTDGTATVVRCVGGDRVRIIDGGELPTGWLGKTHACAQLAATAAGDVLVFVDADVVLASDAVAGAVAQMRERHLSFVSPYPTQVAKSWLERLVQPLLQWSWLTFLPLRVAERSRRASLAAANGQFLVVDSAAYIRAGGHAAVRSDVVEDVALARALVGSGARGGFVDGHRIARCRMYDGSRDLVDGYAKSLWTAFGSPTAAVSVAVMLLGVGLLPWILIAFTPLAWPAAVGGPVGRVVTASRTGSRPRIDAVLHPLSVLALAALVAVSLARHRRGRLVWKSRPVR
jgi:hypothetical protein